jgi:hypothetical protein
MNTPINASPSSTVTFIGPFWKLIISLIPAFVGFSFAVILVLFFGFLKTIYTKPDGASLGVMFFGAVWLAFIYGVLASIALAVPFFVLGFITMFIGWKLKILRWWTCLVSGGLLSSLPMAFILIPLSLGFLIPGHPPHISDVIDIIGMFLGSILCGSISGLCFWLTLRFLDFPEINGSIAHSTQVTNQGI